MTVNQIAAELEANTVPSSHSKLVDDTTEMMVIGQFGKIVRIDTKSVRAAGRATMGVKLLDLDTDDKVASATVIPRRPQVSHGERRTAAVGSRHYSRNGRSWLQP